MANTCGVILAALKSKKTQFPAPHECSITGYRELDAEHDVSKLLPEVDPGGLLEYSVVFTDRALNHMSQLFQQVMRDISATLRQVYNADGVALVPGGGTFAMEAVARQFATGRKCLVIRNGWFSFRWSQIFEAGAIPAEEIVLKARRISSEENAPYAPPPIAEVVAAIQAQQPDLVFAPQVETASGILLPDGYLRQMAEAVHAYGGMLVLDAIAAGTIWLDMKAVGVDVLISAPQKGWSASPSCGLVMLSEHALARIDDTQSTSFACDLRKWLHIMQAYENGGHAYHATLPTDALKCLRDAMRDTEAFGFERARDAQFELGRRVRDMLAARGIASVAAPGFEAPGVVVSYTRDAGIHNSSRFAEQGLQTAAGVPLQCDEPPSFKTFRVGLFGLDKLGNIERTVAQLEQGLERALAEIE